MLPWARNDQLESMEQEMAEELPWSYQAILAPGIGSNSNCWDAEILVLVLVFVFVDALKARAIGEGASACCLVLLAMVWPLLIGGVMAALTTVLGLL